MIISFALLLLTAPGRCVPASGDGHIVLESAVAATGLRNTDTRLMHVQGFDMVSQDYQSDRTYLPFLSSVTAFDSWYSPTTGIERTSARTTLARSSFPEPVFVGTETASYLVRDTALVPSEQAHASLYATRPLNIWAMLHDWMASPDVRVVARCDYRDYPRLVLSRAGPQGEERLFLTEHNHFPIKLDRMESHYLWGQVHVEYVYSTWQRQDDVYLPAASFRIVDGRTTIEREFGPTALVRGDSAPALPVMPVRARPMGYPIDGFLAPTAPDTIRVGPNAFLLKNVGYTETVILARDTVYVLDATQGEARAQHDSTWIGRLFPGHHPIVLVVTDLAWPHIAGVRYWVAQGATVVAHRAARKFLESVVAKRWTQAPDLLERRRAQVHFKFVAVSDTMSLANGDILLLAVDGRTSEVALAAYDRPLRFLWASDYIQTLAAPSAYLDDVWQAVLREHLDPERVAGEHLTLSSWTIADQLARRTPKEN